jgi:hypothetical protein
MVTHLGEATYWHPTLLSHQGSEWRFLPRHSEFCTDLRLPILTSSEQTG